MIPHRTNTLRVVLRQAVVKQLEEAWVYLKDRPSVELNSECLIVGDVEEPSEYATALGFPLEGLETSSIEDCVIWALRHENPPSDELLLYAFVYYWKFVALPARPWTPDPPPAEEIRRTLALEFYRRLGPERINVPCRREGCNNGAIQHSVLCRVHHYESVRNETCPFRGDA